VDARFRREGRAHRRLGAAHARPGRRHSIPRIWLTSAERTQWKQTSDYDEMMRYCRSLEAGSRWVKLEIIGAPGQGRELPC
jgi:hypothetical protein